MLCLYQGSTLYYCLVIFTAYSPYPERGGANDPYTCITNCALTLYMHIKPDQWAIACGRNSCHSNTRREQEAAPSSLETIQRVWTAPKLPLYGVSLCELIYCAFPLNSAPQPFIQVVIPPLPEKTVSLYHTPYRGEGGWNIPPSVGPPLYIVIITSCCMDNISLLLLRWARGLGLLNYRPVCC